MDAVFAEGLEAVDEGVAGAVEVLINGFESFGGYGLDAHEGASDAGVPHGVEKAGVLGGFHGDLGEEDHVVGEFRETFHEFEALFADGFELADAGLVILAFGEAEVIEGDGIEVIVGEGDEAKAAAAEFDDFVDDGVAGALAWFLAVGAPDGAERAVFGAAADGLHGGPHVGVVGHEIPAGGLEPGSIDASAIVDAGGAGGDAVCEDLRPDHIAIAFDDRVGAAVFECFFGIERGVDAPIDDPGAAFAEPAAEGVAAEGVAGVDADAGDVAGLNTAGIDLFERFIPDEWIAEGAGRGGGQDIEPARGDDGSPEGHVAGVH